MLVRRAAPARAATPKKSRPTCTRLHAGRSDPLDPPNPRHPDEPSVLDAEVRSPARPDSKYWLKIQKGGTRYPVAARSYQPTTIGYLVPGTAFQIQSRFRTEPRKPLVYLPLS